MKKILVTLLVASLSLGCAVSRINEEELAKIKTFGVISLLGDTLEFVHVGVTVFNNQESKKDIKDWKVDDVVMSTVKSLVESRGTQRVIPLTYEREVFMRALNTGDWEPIDMDIIKEELKPVLSKQSVDAVILVVKTSSGDYVGKSNSRLSWIGYYSRTDLGVPSFKKTAALYGSYNVYVLDANSLKEVSFGHGARNVTYYDDAARKWVAGPMPGALLELDISYHRKNLSEFSEKELIHLREKFSELIHQSIPLTFEHMGLIQRTSPNQ